jgi:hypothetical protein
MKIAWVCHRDILEGKGGAEESDFEMLRYCRPDDLDITQIKPGGVGTLEEFEKVIVTGWYGYSARELNAIARRKPVLWAHDAQMSGHWLYEEASTIICLTPQHMEYELEKNPALPPERFTLNCGWMNAARIQGFASETREGRAALWAHRPVPHKGLDLALEWAQENDVRLDVLVGRPQDEVLRSMATHEWFVLMSYIFDPGPRSVIEAQLLGCKLAVNDNVGGYFDYDDDKLAKMLMSNGQSFWEVALG